MASAALCGVDTTKPRMLSAVFFVGGAVAGVVLDVARGIVPVGLVEHESCPFAFGEDGAGVGSLGVHGFGHLLGEPLGGAVKIQ